MRGSIRLSVVAINKFPLIVTLGPFFSVEESFSEWIVFNFQRGNFFVLVRSDGNELSFWKWIRHYSSQVCAHFDEMNSRFIFVKRIQHYLSIIIEKKLTEPN